MRFIADAMLGRLARWLRLLGFDTVYHHDIEDRMLLRIARQESRVILTRDTHFLRNDIEQCLFIGSDDVVEQLSQVIKTMNLRPMDTPRCAGCNGILHEVIEKEDIADDVPEYVYLNFNRFLRCGICGSVYWEGSHYQSLMQRVKELI